MKTSFFCLAFAAAISCTLLDPALPLGEPRGSRTGGSGTQPGQSHRRDTSYLVSGTEFPADYDWQRDTASGAVSCKVLLFRNTRKVLEIPAGPGSKVGVSPDRHHIIRSSLYTEYADKRGTVVKRDGQDLASWDEAEKLLGLFHKNGVLYTLGLAQDGSCFTYRENGEILLKEAGALVFGTFHSCGYGPTGALYEDAGQLCFAYMKQQNGALSAFLVRDGKAEKLILSPDAEILDIKQMGGDVVLLQNEAGKTVIVSGGRSSIITRGALYWQEGQLLTFEGHRAIIGSFTDFKGKRKGGIGWEGKTYDFEQDPFYIFCDGANAYALQEIPQACYFLHRQCAFMLGKEPVLALTPKNPAESPFTVYGEKIVKYNLHGYLSGVAVEITE